MLDSAAPIPLDYRLPGEAYYHLIRMLRLALPPPPTDSAEALLRRDHAAIARIAGLCPADAAEADVAAQFVAAAEQWKECLRLAQEPETTREWAAKCRAQAAGMMRQSNSALRLLLRLQDARRKLEADNAACGRLAWIEHVAAALMAEALSAQAAPAHAAPPASAGVAETPPAAPALPPDTRIAGPAAAPEAEPVEDAEPDPIAEAELYAIIYPERAALIRRTGRLPDNVSFGPPDDDIVEALVTANTPALAALDHALAETRVA